MEYSAVLSAVVCVGLLWLIVGWQLWKIVTLDQRMGKLEADKVTSNLASLTPKAPWDGTTLHKFTWCNVTSPPWDLILELRGKINGEEWKGMAAETVLFVGGSIELTCDDPDNQRWNITYTFKEKGTASGCFRDGWNHYFLYAGVPRGWPYGVTSDFDKLFAGCEDATEVKDEDNEHAEG